MTNDGLWQFSNLREIKMAQVPKEEDMSSIFSIGQMNQLADRFEAENFTAEDLTKLGQYKNLCDILGVLHGTHEIVQVEQPPRLSFHREMKLPERRKSNPNEYFQIRKGLYVWDDFANRVLSVAKETGKLPATKITSYNLVKSSNDAEIQLELPENYIWEDASEFCSHLAGMIDSQPDGEEGDLISNGYANIFYVRGKGNEVFAVLAAWDVDGREWRVNARRLGGRSWGAGRRAFSRN